MQFPSNGLPELREVTFSGNIGVRIALLIIHSSKIPINWMDRFLYVVDRPRESTLGAFLHPHTSTDHLGIFLSIYVLK
jgi:hypothetical protein